MAKLARFKATAEAKAEQQRLRDRIAEIAAAAAPLRTSAAPSRADLHALLDLVLALAEVHRQARGKPEAPSWLADEAAEEAARAARPIAAALARSAFGWTEPAEPEIWPVPQSSAEADWIRLETEAPDLWRHEVATRLRRAPHVLPPMAMAALIEALKKLDDGSGDVPPLLKPHRVRGKGRNPREGRLIEEAFWRWIYHQNGAGRRVSDATNDVAAAVGISSKAVEGWRQEWRARDGDDHVKRVLDASKAAGAAGKPFFEGWSLEAAAQRWHAARTPAKARGTNEDA